MFLAAGDGVTSSTQRRHNPLHDGVTTFHVGISLHDLEYSLSRRPLNDNRRIVDQVKWAGLQALWDNKSLVSRRLIINQLDVEGDLRKFSDIGGWVQAPRCMEWLDYDEHADRLSIMDNEVGVTSPESTTQTLPLFEEYTPPVTYPEEVEKTLGTPIEEMFDDDWGLESKEVSPLGEELSLI
ncbi:hypothetical protein Tco_0669366 [Tanacetum coccineum]